MERKDFIQTIHTGQTHIISPLEGTSDWYFSMQGTEDAYDAQILFETEGKYRGNELRLISYPKGKVLCPLKKRLNYFVGMPISYEDTIYFYGLDFERNLVEIFKMVDERAEVSLQLSLEGITIYNLSLEICPLMLTSTDSNRLEIYYPERMTLPCESTEFFIFRLGEEFYFEAWEEVQDEKNSPERYIVRVRNRKGELIREEEAMFFRLPNGKYWKLK